MLDKIKAFFAKELHIDTEQNQTEKLQQACAVLLIEVSRSDYQQSDIERSKIRSLLDALFTLAPDKLEALIDFSEQQVEQSTSMYPFVKLINEHYDYSQRAALLSMMWQVAWADGEISKYEDHVIRKIADLLYISHADFIQAKLAQSSS